MAEALVVEPEAMVFTPTQKQRDLVRFFKVSPRVGGGVLEFVRYTVHT